MSGGAFAETFRSELTKGLWQLGLGAVAPRIDLLSEYANMVLEWNDRAGLTTIVDPAQMAAKHFLDSLLCLRSPAWASSRLVVDVGSGAGFPGLVLALAEPERRYTLVEANAKRCAFLRLAAGALCANVEVVQDRAEEYARLRGGAGRERFDAGLARAVAPLGVSCELVLPLIRVGGSFVAQVGPSQGRALESYASAAALPDAARPAWSVLGAALDDLRRLELPGAAGERWLARFLKHHPAPGRYPRRPAAAQRNPLWVPG
ncbi:MAG: 16S rRNA (guanine(527)-N(7))-methyltransferase RsmG [Bacillota bacterium]|nr:16S rRNA (guanine(527)-N(7))-methyltransferase RsmG [Bacillota bacterium]